MNKVQLLRLLVDTKHRLTKEENEEIRILKQLIVFFNKHDLKLRANETAKRIVEILKNVQSNPLTK